MKNPKRKDDQDDVLSDAEADDIVKEFNDLIEFEHKFYEIVAGTTKFEIIDIPDETGYIPTQAERKILEAQYRAQGLKVLYRTVNKTVSIMYDKDTGLIGMTPNDELKGFSC